MTEPHFSAFDEALLREHHYQLAAGFLEPGPPEHDPVWDRLYTDDPYARGPLAPAPPVREAWGWPLWVLYLVFLMAATVLIFGGER